MANSHSPPVFPKAPVDLVAVVLGGDQVILAWTECGAGGLGFRIERAEGNSSPGVFSEVGRVGPHIAAFRDGSVKPHAKYFYRVHAWDASGASSPSNVVEVTTEPADTELPAG
ncbi:MAG TPA: fibronectin type III domain-containing protein [Syntrophales bacterium]